MQIMAFRRLVYVPERGAYLTEDEVPTGTRVLSISGTELRQRLAQGRELPPWFTPPEIAAELRRSYRSSSQRRSRPRPASSYSPSAASAVPGALVLDD